MTKLVSWLKNFAPFFPDNLERCFFSDDGSTALEVAFKMSLQWRQQNGQKERTGIIAFENAYHGDTLGASSVGGVSRFIKGYGETGLNVYRIGSLEDLQKLPEVVVEDCFCACYRTFDSGSESNAAVAERNVS